MAKKFSELREKMSPAARERANQRTAAMVAAEVVRSWHANLMKEAAGLPFMMYVGYKVIEADGYFKNLAYAVEHSALADEGGKANG